MSLGLELARQRSRVVMFQDKLKQAEPHEIQDIKDQLRDTKRKVKRLENKIKSQPYTY